MVHAGQALCFMAHQMEAGSVFMRIYETGYDAQKWVLHIIIKTSGSFHQQLLKHKISKWETENEEKH